MASSQPSRESYAPPLKHPQGSQGEKKKGPFLDRAGALRPPQPVAGRGGPAPHGHKVEQCHSLRLPGNGPPHQGPPGAYRGVGMLQSKRTPPGICQGQGPGWTLRGRTSNMPLLQGVMEHPGAPKEFTPCGFPGHLQGGAAARGGGGAAPIRDPGGRGEHRLVERGGGADHYDPLPLLQPGDRGLDISGLCRGTHSHTIRGPGEPARSHQRCLDSTPGSTPSGQWPEGPLEG